MILILPAPIVWSLNTDVRKKVILTGLFSMGKHHKHSNLPKALRNLHCDQGPSLASLAFSACDRSSYYTSLATAT